MAKQHVFRFIVGDPNGMRSTAWRIWSYDSEVYATHPSHGGVHKLSFHTPNICRHALVKGRSLQPHVSARLIDEWSRALTPPAGSDEAVKALGIIFPKNHLSDCGALPSHKAVCLPSPGANRALQVELMYTFDSEAAFVAALAGSGRTLHAFQSLPNGEHWAVTSFEHPWQDQTIIMPGPPGAESALVMPGMATPSKGRSVRFTSYALLDAMICVELSGFRMDRATAEMMYAGAGTITRGRLPIDQNGDIWRSPPVHHPATPSPRA